MLAHRNLFSEYSWLLSRVISFQWKHLPYQIMMRNTEAADWFFFEADYFQYEQGLMTDEQWQAKLNVMAGNLLRCETRDVYNIRITRIPVSMIELLNDYELPQCD